MKIVPRFLFSKDRGFTFTEVILSIAIIATVLLPMIAMLAGGSVIVADAEDRFAASGVAAGIVSELRYSTSKRAFIIISGTIDEDGKPIQAEIPVPAPREKNAVFLAFDRYGLLLRTLSKEEFDLGMVSTETEIFYLTKIEVEGGESGFSMDQGAPPMSRITLFVEAPAFTSKPNRSRHKLTTVLAGKL